MVPGVMHSPAMPHPATLVKVLWLKPGKHLSQGLLAAPASAG
jgi:hypothetical protein